jgi:hypothetical protein
MDAPPIPDDLTPAQLAALRAEWAGGPRANLAGRAKRIPGGRKKRSKPITKEQRRAQYLKHHEKRLAYQREYYRTHKVKILARMAACTK